MQPPRRDGGTSGLTVLLLTLGFVLVGGVLALRTLVSNRGTELVPVPSATEVAVLPELTETPEPPAVPTAAPSPTPPPPTAVPTASPTVVAFVPTPTPTASLAPPPTRAPTPQPTPAPTPTPTPRLKTMDARISDELFVGDYNGSGSGRYHRRTATWIYGQGTRFSTMTAQFELDRTQAATGRASLTIVGLEGAQPEKQTISIVLNGTTIYRGRDPLPNDFAAGPSGEGNWGSATFRFPATLLRRNNELSITNLTQSDCTLCPDFFMIDYAVIRYRVIV